MEKYKIVGIKKHKSKQDKDYYIAYVLFENDYTFDILNVLIKEQQVQALQSVINDDTFELDRFLKTSYNAFNKRYQLTINYGL